VIEAILKMFICINLVHLTFRDQIKFAGGHVQLFSTSILFILKTSTLKRPQEVTMKVAELFGTSFDKSRALDTF